MPAKDKKKAGSSKTKSSSSSKKGSSKDKKKSSSSSKRSSKSKSPSKTRRRSATDDEEQPGSGSTPTAAAEDPSAVLSPSSADQQDPKASSDFEAGLLFQRFARNGGVDAKDFQRMWRERGNMSPVTGTAPLSDRRSSDGSAQQDRRGQEGGRGVEPDKVFEFGQLFQKFDTDGDGRLGRADFERMIGGMLDRLGGGNGGSGGGEGGRREVARHDSSVPPAPTPPPPPLPPPPSEPSPAGPSITHYDETTGVPLAREAVASQQALGHTVVPLSEAYSRRLSRLQSLASSRLMPVRERLLQLRRRFQGRSEEVRAAKSAIERETLADTNAIVERLRSVEALKQATLVQGVSSVTAELEGVEKLSDEVARVTSLPSSAPDATSLSSTRYVPDFEEAGKMVALVQSYRELCNSIDRVASRPFVANIDVQADDFPQETAERLEVLRRADRYEQALSVKDQMLWVAMQECQRLEGKCQEERGLGQEFAEEAQEWVKLTGKLSDRVNALTAEADQMSKLRKTNELLVRENQELMQRVEAMERDTGSIFDSGQLAGGA